MTRVHPGTRHWRAAAVPGRKRRGGNSDQSSEEVKAAQGQRAPGRREPPLIAGCAPESFLKVTLVSVLPLLSTMAQNHSKDL